VIHRVQRRDLPDVVAHKVEKTSSNIGIGERPEKLEKVKYYFQMKFSGKQIRRRYVTLTYSPYF
jgi:hypothetical protein